MSRTGRGRKVKSAARSARTPRGGAGAAKAATTRKQATKVGSRTTEGPLFTNSDHVRPTTASLFADGALPRSTEKPDPALLGLYDPDDIVDAPEHYALSKALGILTWDIWDHEERSVGERKRDFVTAFPPRNPVLFCVRGMERTTDREWSPRDRTRELERFLSRDGRANGIDSVLAHYGLKLKGAPPLQRLRTNPARDPLQAARERNHGLRVLHGSVDIEPKDMDSAKTAFVEQQEKKRAAEEIREARKRLKAELDRDEDPSDRSS
jgi:hypothetical protein